MKHTKLLLIGLLAAIPLFGVAITANAQSFRTGNNITVPQNRTIDSTLYVSGRNIDVAGTVRGDVICAGQNVNISGTVEGDVLCAGQSVHINGTVEGNVRIAAQNVTVSSTINRNANIIAQSVTTDSNSRIGRDIGIMAQDTIINGQVGRDLAVASGNVNINNTIGRNVHANVGNITLQNDAQVQGFIDYTSANDIDRQSGSEVNGRVTRHDPPQGDNDTSWIGFGWLFTLYVVIAMLLVALVLVLLMPRAFQAAANTALASLGKTILIGIAASILVPILIVGLMFTIIGIPLGILLLLAWLVVLFLSGPFAAYLLGRLMLRDNARNAVVVMLLGAVVLIILYLIPFLNILVLLLALWFGIGMILQSLPWHRPQYALDRAAEPALQKTPQTKSPSAKAPRP